MCIIVVKCKGSDFAPKEVIARCMETNPHGFSIAWNSGGKVNTFRTMNPSEMLTRYEQLVAELNPAETAMLFHARIKSNGSIRIENTHCYTNADQSLAFCHNGILSNIKDRDDLTDSETFFRDFFLPAYEGISPTFAFKMSKAMICHSNNKFAFLNKDGEVTFVTGLNQFSKEQFPGLRGKIYFSNGSWKPTLSYGLGFNPYSDVRHKPEEAKPSVAFSTALPPVGERHKASPAKALAITIPANSERFYQQRMDELFAPK